MPLTGPQRKLVRDALLSAFPSEAALEQLVSFQLNEDLAVIVENGSLASLALRLIQWAESQGRLPELVSGARRENPGNAELLAAAQQLGLEPGAGGTDHPAPGSLPEATIPWPDGPLVLDAATLEAARAEAALGIDSLYTRLGTVYLRHIVAGQDVRRDATDDLMQAIIKSSDTAGMRFQLICASGGNGKSTFLLRLAYELAERGEHVLVARSDDRPDYTLLRRACQIVSADPRRPSRRVYLLLENLYREHLPLMTRLAELTIANLTIIGTSRYNDIPEDALTPGIALLLAPLELATLNAAEAARLLDRIRACGMLKAADPATIIRAIVDGGEPLLVAVARLTRIGGLDTYTEHRLREMNEDRDPTGLEVEDWTPFLRIYYAVANYHAWGTSVPQVLLPTLTGLTRQRVNALLCEPDTPEVTAQAREYLRGTCGGSWRTDHELIAVATMRQLGDRDQSRLTHLAEMLEQLAALTADERTRAAAASLGAQLFRRCADTPTLIFSTAAPELDTLAPIDNQFSVPLTPATPAHAALAVVLDIPALAPLLLQLRTTASPTDLANNYMYAYLRLVRWNDVITVAEMVLAHPLRTALDQAVALHLRGTVYHELLEYDKALEDFTRSLGLRPAHPPTLNYRGFTYVALARYEEALADFTQSLVWQPEQAETLHNRGITLLRMRRYDKALEDIMHCLDLWPRHPPALYDLACIHSLRGENTAALAALTAAIQSDAKFQKIAQTDEDFAGLRGDLSFRALVGLPLI